MNLTDGGSPFSLRRGSSAKPSDSHRQPKQQLEFQRIEVKKVKYHQLTPQLSKLRMASPIGQISPRPSVSPRPSLSPRPSVNRRSLQILQVQSDEASIIRRIQVNQLFRGRRTSSSEEEEDKKDFNETNTVKTRQSAAAPTAIEKIGSPSPAFPPGSPRRRSYCFETNPQRKLQKNKSPDAKKPQLLGRISSKAVNEGKSVNDSAGRERPLSRLRPMSPVERTHNKNLFILNRVSSAKRADSKLSSNHDEDDDDTLQRLKEIHIQSLKKRIQPPLRSAKDENTHEASAIEKFRQVYKSILREKEHVSITNSAVETPIQAILFQEHRTNAPPLKLGIVKQRKDSKVVDISHYHLGDRGIENFCAGLHRLRNYECLNVRENGLTSNGIQKVIESLKEEQIRELDFSSNIVSLANIQLLVRRLNGATQTLQVIKLEKTQLNDESVDLLCTGLLYVKTLRVINLSSNRISNRSCYSIEDMIKELPQLQELYLGWNVIQGEGGTLILDACRKSGSVKVLNLSENLLGIATNNQLFSQAFKRLCEIESSSTLIFLDLSFNQFDDDQSLFIVKTKKRDTKILRFHFQGHEPISFQKPEIPIELRLIHRLHV